MTEVSEDADSILYLSLKGLSEQEKRILRFVAKFPSDHRFPALPQDIETAMGLNNRQVTRVLHRLELDGYVESLLLRGKLRGVVCTGIY